ncbi:acyl carrier protein [Streptomyces sp. NPDC018045]|uniref:acyl carrier protein n=1 Tax=Streptomyces sp. NPDC018045 TaxID=3365037 RepID=UPI0037921FAC
MTYDDVRDRVKEFLAPQLGGHELADEDDIFALGLVNSLFAMQLALFVEREFSLRLGPEDMEFDNFRSVKGIADLVTAKTAAAA